MNLISSIATQGKIWQSYLRLTSDNPVMREAAMVSLYEVGEASIPCLTRGIKPGNAIRSQCASATVLHQLGDKKGMEFLLETLRWKFPVEPAIGVELEPAFLRIGNPDAAPALLTVWEKNTDWRDENPLVQSICHLWEQLGDPRILDALCQQAFRIPVLFEKTIPAFGEVAVRYLERMLKDPAPQQRLLAVQTLRHIQTGSSVALLIPLLRDPSDLVRSAIPEALSEAGVPSIVMREVLEALRAGYSSPEAIRALGGSTGQLDITTADAFVLLLERWNPHALITSGDTSGAVLAAIPYLVNAPLSNARISSALCGLLERRPGPTLTAEIVQVIGARGLPRDEWETQLRKVLLAQLSSPDEQVRNSVANALRNWGDTYGVQFLEILAKHRPQGNILSKFQTLLRGGSDAGKMATQAMQQASQWLSRVSKEAFDKQKQEVERAVLLQDTRTYPLLEELLANALDSLQRSHNPAETEQYVAVSVASLRLLASLPPDGAKQTQNLLIRALTTVKHGTLYEGNVVTPFQNAEVRDIGNLVRVAAAEALFEIYDNASFAIFLEILYHPLMEVKGTAIVSLGRLGEVRALPHLQSITGIPGHPLVATAQEAIAAIKRINPHVMTLLRASSANQVHDDKLLRPVMGNTPEAHPEQLLRPSSETEGR